MIVQWPDEWLTKTSTKIVDFGIEIQPLAQKLIDQIKQWDWWGHIFGLGIAAPQIGINQRMIVIKRSYRSYLTLVNPTIISAHVRLPWIERCFSTSWRAATRRAFWIRVRYQTLDGKTTTRLFVGPKAAILQHEIDHLDGILIRQQPEFDNQSPV